MQISAFIDNKTSRRANILWLLVLLIAFTIPISQWVCVRLIFVALVFSLFVSQSILSVRSVFSTSWDIMLYLMVLLIGLTYSEELSFGLSVIETNFSFFAVPLIFNKVENFNKEKLYQVLYVFTFGLICSSLICLANACFHFDGDAHIFFFYQFVGLLDFQPTYFAYYLIVAICFGLYILYFDRALISDKWVILILSFLFLILMLTGGLTTFMSILLILSFFFLKYILAKKGGIKIIVFSIVVTMLATMFVFSFIYKALDSEPNKITDHW